MFKEFALGFEDGLGGKQTFKKPVKSIKAKFTSRRGRDSTSGKACFLTILGEVSRWFAGVGPPSNGSRLMLWCLAGSSVLLDGFCCVCVCRPLSAQALAELDRGP